ncbi:sialate O-acetylesterase [Phocaeicola sp.]
MTKRILFLGMLAAFATAEAKVTLPALFSDNMVLQQKSDVALHGRSSAKKDVTITVGWNKHIYTAPTNAQGNWKIEIPTPSAGGPYEITLSDGEEQVLKNIMIGEIWLYAGEVNAGMPIEGASQSSIRLFQVKKEISLVPKEDLDLAQGEWQECSTEAVAGFPTEGYFFASQLQKTLKVPIGVIDCTWAGTPAEAWSSYNALESLADYGQEAEMLESLGFDPEKIEAEYARKREEWYQALYEHDMGWCDDHQVWAEPDYSDENWKEMELPGYWEDKGMKDFDGVVWFRKTVDIPRTWARKAITVELGPIADEDIVYYNGVEIGRTGGTDTPRRYTVPYKLVKRGKAVLTVRVTDYEGKGGICGKAEQMKMSIKGKEPVSLAGDWKYLAGLSLTGIPPVPASPGTNPAYPTGLFNAMIHPLTRFPIRGVIWNQGESNKESPDEYTDLFMSLITDWRDKWQKPDMPFLFVQLPNDPNQKDTQVDTDRAAMREAQAQALYLNNTGMVVTTDIDHTRKSDPQSKLEVGLRLSQQALRQAYGKKRMPQYPMYKAHSIEGNTIRISFENVGKGFLHPDPIRGFLIAGTDHVFYPATVSVKKKEVIVQSPEVPHPIAVRYNWADSPDGTLFGASGLPVVPFRTDKW